MSRAHVHYMFFFEREQGKSDSLALSSLCIVEGLVLACLNSSMVVSSLSGMSKAKVDGGYDSSAETGLELPKVY